MASDVVMAGLVPAIHALAAARKTWMRGSSPRMTAIQTNGISSDRDNSTQRPRGETEHLQWPTRTPSRIMTITS
jgi:hypothetical protein